MATKAIPGSIVGRRRLSYATSYLIKWQECRRTDIPDQSATPKHPLGVGTRLAASKEHTPEAQEKGGMVVFRQGMASAMP
jgi:hypothetical protein